MPSKFTPVIISSLVIIIISLFPFINFINLFCCAGVIIGGAAGTAYYNSRLKSVGGQIQYKDAAAIGVLSGIISALVVVIGTTLMTLAVKQNPIPELYKVLDTWGYQIPPEAEKFLQRISEEYSKQGFSITLTLISLGADLITYPIFSTIGGMLAVAIFGKKKNAVQ